MPKTSKEGGGGGGIAKFKINILSPFQAIWNPFAFFDYPKIFGGFLMVNCQNFRQFVKHFFLIFQNMLGTLEGEGGKHFKTSYRPIL